MIVESITRTVYRSPRAGRCYMTKRAAFEAEARAIIKAKYPTEQAEYEDGRMYYPGSHWRDATKDPEKLLRRVARMVRNAYEASIETASRGRAQGGMHESDDAKRFRQAIALEDNVELLYAATRNHAPDGDAIRREFDDGCATQGGKDGKA